MGMNGERLSIGEYAIDSVYRVWAKEEREESESETK